jgi:uncharacterized protein (TIGR04255 family)
MTQRYPRPPITEAVIEIKFEEPIERESIEKVRSRLLDTYPLSEPHNVVGIFFNVAQRSTKFQEGETGYKLSTQDRTDSVFVTTRLIATSRLAPYQGWESFCKQASRNWEIWKKAIGYRKVGRVGVRYVNRIDVPMEADGGVNVEEYLTFYPETPTGVVPAMLNFNMQMRMSVGADNCDFVLNMASVESPVPNHASFVFDQDLYREQDVPQHDEQLWQLINAMRTHKNHIFEAAITDKTRALFQ